MDRNISISTTFFKVFFVWKYILPLLREKEACYGNQTWYSGSRGEELCQLLGSLEGYLHGEPLF